MQRHDNNFPGTPSARLFLLLLHGGLNGRLPTLDQPTVSPREWDAILRMARLQAVTAFVWDGIQLLPDELKPPVDIGRQFFMDTLRTEQTARRLNALLATLLADVETTGIAVALLKGQGYAALYPNPLHRQPGDIDIYSGPECARLQRALPPAYERDNGPAYFHDKLHRDGILIENHRLVAELAWGPHKRALERMVSEWFPANICQRTSLGLSPPRPTTLVRTGPRRHPFRAAPHGRRRRATSVVRLGCPDTNTSGARRPQRTRPTLTAAGTTAHCRSHDPPVR